MKKINWPLFGLILLVLLVFLPSLEGTFLYWDDEANLLLNPLITSKNLIGFWLKPYYAMYIPLTYSIWGFVFAFRGADASSFHFLNLALHLLNTVLVYRLFRKILAKDSRGLSLFAAALFAFHPLQVGTVSWISGGRDLLAAGFSLLSVDAFLSENRSRRRILGPAFFALGLLCKPAFVLLPLLLYFFKIVERNAKPLAGAVEFIPWALLAAPAIVLANSIQKLYGVVDVEGWKRPLIMADTYGFYLQKFIWPFNLSTDYGRSPQWLLQNWTENWGNLLWFVALLFLAFSPWTKKTWRAPVICFVILLLPVSGIVTFGFQRISTVADRYMYLPLVTLIWGLVRQLSEIPARRFSAVPAALLILPLAFLSYERTYIWQSNESFFGDMLAHNPSSYSAHTNLGRIAMERGDFQTASEHIFKAYELAPEVFENLANRLVLLQRLGRHEELVALDARLEEPLFVRARLLEPAKFANLLNSIAVSLDAVGKPERAFTRTCEALGLAPENTTAQQNLKILSGKIGHEARCDYFL